MSIELMVWVWRNSDTKGPHRLALLALADIANDDGVCWPSYEHISNKVNCTRRQAMRLVKQLELAGYIKVWRRSNPVDNQDGKRNLSNLYQVLRANVADPKTEEAPVTPESVYKQRLATAMERGRAVHVDLLATIQELFRISPNTNRKDWREFVLWVKDRPDGQTLQLFAKWWYANDWRGVKGQSPTISQIQELWLQAFTPTFPGMSESEIRKNEDGSFN